MKKYIYILVGILLLTGLAFALSNTALFKGSFEDKEAADGVGDTESDGGPDLGDDDDDDVDDPFDVETWTPPTGGGPTGGGPTGDDDDDDSTGSVGYIGITVYAEDGETIDGLWIGDGEFEVYETDGTEVTDDVTWVSGVNDNDGKYMMSFSDTTEKYYDIKVLADGYVSNSTLKRFSVASSQSAVEEYPSLELEYAQAIVVNDSDGNPISNLDVYSGPSYGTECHYWSDEEEYVCPTPINSDKTYSVGGGGYITVQGEFSNEPRTSHDDKQRVLGHSGSFMLTSDEYAYTVTVTDASTGTAIEDATVKYRIMTTSDGDDCDYAFDGIYWCATSRTVSAGQLYYTISANGYDSKGGYFDEGRTAKTDAGVNVDVALSKTGSDDVPLDADGDGLSDDEEAAYGTGVTDSDSDDDGLTDGEEVLIYLTDPFDADSDSDGMEDYWEVYYGLNPLTDDSTENPDSDAYTNLEEYTNGTDPTVIDASAEDDEEEPGSGDEWPVFACKSITLSPDSYEMTADQSTANDIDVSFEVDFVDPTEVSFLDIIGKMFASIFHFDSDAVTLAYEGAPPTFPVTLESTGAGTFTYDGASANPTEIEVETVDITVESVVYSGGVENDTLTASFTNEDGSICSDSFTITKAAAADDDDNTTDTDGDGLTNAEEALLETDPALTDTDGDGYSDYDEVINYETDPLDATEYPGSDDTTNDDILESDSYSCTDPFKDTTSHWAQDLICRLYQIGVVKGRSSTLFEPDDYVTRAEWMKILVLSAGYDESQASGKSESFTDVTSTDWYYPYMVVAEYLDVARSRDGAYFNPNTPITRGDAVLYTIRMTGETLYGWGADDITFSDLSTSDYFTYAVLIANQTIVDVPDKGETPVIEGYDNDTFKPYAYITRAEAVALALRAILAWF